MKKAESPLAPFFGRTPQEFGIPERPADWPNGVDPVTREPLPPPRDPADVVHDMELLYAAWLDHHPRSAKMVLNLAQEPLRIFREQLHVMMQAYSRAVANYKAATQQAVDQDRFIQQNLEARDLRGFLGGNFPRYLERADAGNIPLAKLCQEIMMDLQKQIDDMKVKS